MSVELVKRKVMQDRDLDGFLDFKIFVRLAILELKLMIFPTIPSAKEMAQAGPGSPLLPRDSVYMPQATGTLK